MVDRRAHHQPQRVAHALEAADRVLPVATVGVARARPRSAGATANRPATSHAAAAASGSAGSPTHRRCANLRRPPLGARSPPWPHGGRTAARGRSGGGRAQARLRCRPWLTGRKRGATSAATARCRKRGAARNWPEPSRAASSARRPAARARRAARSVGHRPELLWLPHLARPAATLALGRRPSGRLPELEHDVLMALGDDNRVGFAFASLTLGAGAARTRHRQQPRSYRRRRGGARGAPEADLVLEGHVEFRARRASPSRTRGTARRSRASSRTRRGRRLADRGAQVGRRVAHRAAVETRARRPPRQVRVGRLFFRANLPAPRADDRASIPDYYTAPGRHRPRPTSASSTPYTSRRRCATTRPRRDFGRRHPRRRRLRDPPRAGGRRRAYTRLASDYFLRGRFYLRRRPRRSGVPPAAGPADVVGGVHRGARRHFLRRRRAELVLAEARGRAEEAGARFCPAPKAFRGCDDGGGAARRCEQHVAAAVAV